MDLNHEYAAHQRALMCAGLAGSDEERAERMKKATGIAGRISAFQHGLGAAAACAWSQAQFADPAKP